MAKPLYQWRTIWYFGMERNVGGIIEKPPRNHKLALVQRCYECMKCACRFHKDSYVHDDFKAVKLIFRTSPIAA